METRASVCFPYRSDGGRRDQILAWTSLRWGLLFPQFEQIWGQSDDGLFNRSQAINRAVQRATHDIILIADTDTVFHKPFVEEALQLLKSAPWGFAYRSFFTLTEAASNQILALPPDETIPVQSVTFEDWGNLNVSGVLAIRKSAFMATGFDEGFVGWGYEDMAFAQVAERELGPPFRVEQGYVFHLWHERAHQGEDQNLERYEGLYRP